MTWKLSNYSALLMTFAKDFNKCVSEDRIEYTKPRLRKRIYRTTLSVVLTILLLFHRSNYRTFYTGT